MVGGIDSKGKKNLPARMDGWMDGSLEDASRTKTDQQRKEVAGRVEGSEMVVGLLSSRNHHEHARGAKQPRNVYDIWLNSKSK